MLNMILLIFLSIVYFAWLEEVKPFELSKNHKLETANELLLLFLCYHMICFTDLTDLETQIEHVQPSFIVTFVLLIIVNFIALIVDFVSPYKIKRWWQMRKIIRYQMKKRIAAGLIKIKVRPPGSNGEHSSMSGSGSENSSRDLSSSVSDTGLQ